MLRSSHEAWMRFAIKLAEKGRSAVSPNPMVGACVVRCGRLISSGYHEKFGGPHAERYALEKAGHRARGATLYVTLEPCATWQKTPPCVPLIKEKGIREVVIGSLDPNPLNHGKGVRFLRKNNIRVTVGILSKAVQEQNEGFFKYITEKRPFVTLKMAQTLDGKIATHKGLSRWISCPKSRNFVHELRARHDAVLVGKNTFYKDNPRFTIRRNAKSLMSGKPWKVVVVSGGEDLSKQTRFFEDERLGVLVFPEDRTKDVLKNTASLKHSLAFLPVKSKKGKLNIPELLKKLASLGITTLLVEGGGELAWSFLETHCVDRLYWIIAPKIFGGRQSKTSVEGSGVDIPSKAFLCRDSRVFKLGDDWVWTGHF